MSDTSQNADPKIGVANIDARREQLAENYRRQQRTSYSGTSPIEVRKLGHMVYEVSNLERSLAFWTNVMGFVESERNSLGMVFLRCNSDHHGIALKQGTGDRPASDGLRFHHLALEVDSVEVLIRAREYLKDNEIPIVFEGRFGSGSNIGLNFLDPDGFEFELYCEMDQVDDVKGIRPKAAQRPVRSLEEAIENPKPEDW